MLLRFWSQIGFVFLQEIEAVTGENWVCYVRAKFAAEVEAATVSKHRERHRRPRRRLSGLDSFGHEDRGDWLEGLGASGGYYRLVAMYSYQEWRDRPLLTGIRLSVL